MNPKLSANVAGLAGAAAMAGVAIASRKLGLTTGEPSPRQVGPSTGAEADGAQRTKTPEGNGMGVTAYITFALSSALLYAQVRKYLKIPGPFAGALFGLATWTADIAGIAPTLGLRKAPWQQQEARTVMSIAGHILFGVVVGLLYDRLSDERT